jgi:hypothetical protein
MAFVFQSQYEPGIEQSVQAFYRTLSEKDQRRFVAVEAQRLGFGGVSYVAGVFGCSERTIERGARELAELPHDPAAGRVRRPGGGRKKRLTPTRNSNRT